VLCQSGNHKKLLCELHGARLKGSSFLPEMRPQRQAERQDSHKRHKKHNRFTDMRGMPSRTSELEFANLEPRSTEVDEEALLHT
jgi:hypothetical protein